MADVNRGNRPLSPFMIGQYYRPQMTSISSIMVRITGIATLGAAVLVVAWLLAAAGSEAAFAVVDGLLRGGFEVAPQPQPQPQPLPQPQPQPQP